jgi:hypothetical protein
MFHQLAMGLNPIASATHTKKPKKQKTARPWIKNPYLYIFIYLSVFTPLLFFVVTMCVVTDELKRAKTNNN